jgi:hypothetical protein
MTTLLIRSLSAILNPVLIIIQRKRADAAAAVGVPLPRLRRIIPHHPLLILIIILTIMSIKLTEIRPPSLELAPVLSGSALLFRPNVAATRHPVIMHIKCPNLKRKQTAYAELLRIGQTLVLSPRLPNMLLHVFPLAPLQHRLTLESEPRSLLPSQVPGS